MFFNDYDELKHFCILINSVIRIPVFFIEDTGLIIFEVSENTIKNPLYDYRVSIFKDIISTCNKNNSPQVVSTKYLENFLVLFIELNTARSGYLVFGPSIAHIYNENLTDIEITPKEKSMLIKYYKNLPLINYHELIKLGIFVYYITYKKQIDFESINKTSKYLENVCSKIEIEHNIHRDLNYLHPSSTDERFLFDFITNGETEKLKEFLKQTSFHGEYVVLAKNPLRSWKNLVICFITISGRAAMEGGLPTDTVYAICDSCIQELEELASIKDVQDFGNKIYIDFAERVQKIKKQKYPKLITMCLSYISKNLDKRIRLSDISEYLNVNCSYISSLFKEVIGIPISEYVLNEKTKEAKRMLLFTQFSVLDISNAFGFCDQSHFTKTFKRVTGLTPKEFRNSYSSSSLWNQNI